MFFSLCQPAFQCNTCQISLPLSLTEYCGLWPKAPSMASTCGLRTPSPAGSTRTLKGTTVMPEICYGFSAISALPDPPILYVTTKGVPLNLNRQQTSQVWQNIIECFNHAGLPRVAGLLLALSYERTPDGIFVIKGPAHYQKLIFDLLTHHYSKRSYQKEQNKHSPVSVDFFWSQHPTRLRIHFLHCGTTYSWHVDHVKPPPILCLQARDSVPT